MLFSKTVNECIVFNGFKKLYVCQTNDIRWDMSFKQHMKKNYNCEHFEIIFDREETTYMGLTNPAMYDVKILNCT